MKKYIITILVFLYSNYVFADIPKIITTVEPIAGIISTLSKNMNIDVLVQNNNCAHHYHLKPSDLIKIDKADIIIYIDNSFDSFITKFLKESNAEIIKISDIKNLNLIKNINSQSTNWHIWMDLENVKIILNHCAEIIINKFPELRSEIYQNLKNMEKQIDILQKFKNEKFHDIKHLILMGDSLEYLFLKDNHIDITHIENSKQKTINNVLNLNNLLSNSSSKCIITNNLSDKKQYKKLHNNINIIFLSGEDYVMKTEFLSFYSRIITQIINCKNIE
jgi:zinc transport system substrate-binding protein